MNPAERIDAANQLAVERMIAARPRLVDVRPARAWLPDLRPHQVLHAGPPIGWDRMVGPARGAVLGALMFEGLAASPREAERLAASGEIDFQPNHHFGGVGGMSGIITSSTPLYIVEEPEFGNTAFAGMLAPRLIFGAYDAQALRDLGWTRDVLAPVLGAAIRAAGGLDIQTLQARAIHMGDEMHNRSNAATALFARQIAPWIVESCGDSRTARDVLLHLNSDDSFFTFIGMAACKAVTRAAHDIPYCSLVTTMARNGVEFGVRVSCLGDQWFTGPASRIEGPTFPGYQPDDAARDIGDSCITETAGIGAFLMAGAPAIMALVGGTASQALQYTRDMYEITAGRNPHFTVPSLDFAAGPIGIDIRKVVATGRVPIIDTAMAHKDAGVGVMIGAGLVSPPFLAFENAFRAFAAHVASEAVI
jgi:hypothetical protein